MLEEDLLTYDKRYNFCGNKKDWERLNKLARKLGRPYSTSLLVRKFIREGLERMEKEKKK